MGESDKLTQRYVLKIQLVVHFTFNVCVPGTRFLRKKVAQT